MKAMTAEQKREKRRITGIAFWSNLILSALSLLIVFESMESLVLWKIVASLVGFIGFSCLSLLAFPQMMKLGRRRRSV